MGRAGVSVGVGAEPARLSFYARNRFELWCILPPKWNFLRFGHPTRWPFSFYFRNDDNLTRRALSSIFVSLLMN